MGKPLQLKVVNRKKQTQRTETSKYLEENKTIVIPQVVASERGSALKFIIVEKNRMEMRIKEGDNPVFEDYSELSEYGGAGETLSEYTCTIR